MSLILKINLKWRELSPQEAGPVESGPYLLRRSEIKRSFYYFAKNARANISADDLKALKRLAKKLLEHSDKALTKAIKYEVLI